MRSNRHMGITLAATAAMLAASLPLADSAIGKPYESKVGRGTKPNPDKQLKAEKKRERKAKQRLLTVRGMK